MIINIIFIIVTVGLIVLAFSHKMNLRIHPHTTYDLPNKYLTNNILHDFILIILFVTAFLVRFYKFGIIPFGFNQDGAMGAVDALALSNHATDRFGMWLPVHFTAWKYGQMSVLLSYLTVPFIKIFGLTVFSARVPMLIVSLLAIYVIYIFTKDVYDSLQATIILFLCAINPWHIMQSRWALDCNLLPHFTLFSLFFLYKGLKKEVYLYISMFFFALCMYSYGISFFFIIPLLITICIYLLIKKQITFLKVLKCILVYLFFATPIILVMIINYLKLPTIKTPFFTIPFFEDSVRSNDLLFFSKNFFKQMIINANALINISFLQKKDLPWNTIKEFGSTYIFNLPFLIIGFYYSIKNLIKCKKDDFKGIGNALFVFWFLCSIFTGLCVNSVNVNRINVIFYPIIILSGIGIYNIFFRNTKTLKLIIFVFTIYILSFGLFTNAYFVKHSDYLGTSFFRGFGESIESAELTKSDVIYITTRTYQGDNKQIIEILTMFYSKIDSEYFQGKTNKHIENSSKLLPYKKRYIYLNFSENINIIQNAKPNTVFVLKIDELPLFSDAKFIIKKYWNYACATSK